MRTLYKKTANGLIQTWSMEIDGSRYRAFSGKLNGVITGTRWTQCKGKNLGRSNETSPEEQALSEVESKYRKRRKSGYTDTPEEAEASELFYAMAAHNYEDYRKKAFVDGPVWSQPKLDGIRCIASARNLHSREHEPIVSVPHIQRALEPVFEKFPEMIIDGELYNHELRDAMPMIQGLVSKTRLTPEILADTEENIEFHVFDVVDPGLEGEYYDVRLEIVEMICANDPALIAVETEQVSNEEELDACYEHYLDNGYEGQMVRLPGTYQNKRTSLLLKRKTFVDSEFEVVGIEEGKGNSSGQARKVYLRLDTDPDVVFKADIMGNESTRAKYLKDKDRLIGGLATVKYFSKRTPDGIPRFGKLKVFHGRERKY